MLRGVLRFFFGVGRRAIAGSKYSLGYVDVAGSSSGKAACMACVVGEAGGGKRAKGRMLHGRRWIVADVDVDGRCVVC